MEESRRRRTTRAFAIAAALAFVLASYWMADRYLRGRELLAEQRLESQYARRSVVVARQPLAVGQTVVAGQLAQRQVPERFLASDAVAPADIGTLVGKRLQRSVTSGEAVTLSAVVSSTAAALSSTLRTGARAVTISVDEASSSAGLVAPGDLVDLLFLPDSARSSPRGQSIRPLLQAVRVVATGTETVGAPAPGGEAAWQPRVGSFGTVTLDVSPEQAVRIALAERSGEVTAVLRADGDAVEVLLPSISVADLLASDTGGRPKALARRAAKSDIEYIIGGQSTGTGVAIGTVPSAEPVRGVGQ